MRGGAAQSSLWLHAWPTRLTPLVDLICIPGAGAGASRFKAWQAHLPAYCRVHVAQLPGRENRIDEAAINDLTTVVDHLAGAVLQIPRRRPILLFGHSMGAVLAYELTKRLCDHQCAPARLFMSATTPPSGQADRAPVESQELERLLLAFDPENKQVIDNPDLFESLEPVLRADFQLLRRHSVSATDDPPDVLTHLLCGRSDPVVPEAAVARWAAHLGCEIRHRTVDGGHQFPFNESLEAVTQLITDEINAVVDQQTHQ